MDDELPTVVSGTRRKAQELADGTLRVMVDIDPRFKSAFHRLFPNIDMPCALAPLVADFEHREPKQEEPKGGPLCKLAAMWCKDEDFWNWLIEVKKLGAVDEELAAIWIRDTCGIDSRRELDQNEWAAERFQRSVRAPFMEWMKDK